MNRTMKAFSRFILLVFVIAVIAMSLGCTAEKEAVLETQRGSVSGLVLDTNKKAVSGATITSNRSLYKASTDQMGRFMFTSLDEGHHYFTVERDGFYLGSATVELGYGQVLEGVTIVVDKMEKMIKTSVSVCEKTSVVLDVSCFEDMAVSVTYRELSNMPTSTQPSSMKKQHRIVLNNLFPDSTYYYTVTGVTADGRNFTTNQTSFKTRSLYDIEGAPDSPENFNIIQDFLGPRLSWEYRGADPIKGFRIYRSENGGKMVLLRDETDILPSQNFLVDDCFFAGRYYTYQVFAVDYEGNTSELPAEKSFVPCGAISENIVWKKEWSPINIDGDIMVPSRYSLTIEPGCVIRFSSSSDENSVKSSLCEFIVEGTIIACGTDVEPVKFLSQSSIPQKNDWDGIRFLAKGSEEPSRLSHVIMSGADTGLEIYSGNITVDNYTARYCRTGLALITASGTVLSDLYADNCETGVKVDGTYNCTLSHVKTESCDVGAVLNNNTSLKFNSFDLRNCKTSGIQSSDRDNTIIRNGVVNSSSKGIQISGEGCDLQFVTVDAKYGILLEGAENTVIRNNIIVNMAYKGSGTGIEDMSGYGNSFPYNNIYGFMTATKNCTQSGASIYNKDPLFEGNMGAEFDYHLRQDSPLLTVASNNGQIGAYGAE